MTKTDFLTYNDITLYDVCFKGYIDIIKYLHKNIGFTKEDFYTRNNMAYKVAVRKEHSDIVNYFDTEINT